MVGLWVDGNYKKYPRLTAKETQPQSGVDIEESPAFFPLLDLALYRMFC